MNAQLIGSECLDERLAGHLILQARAIDATTAISAFERVVCHTQPHQSGDGKPSRRLGDLEINVLRVFHQVDSWKHQLDAVRRVPITYYCIELNAMPMLLRPGQTLSIASARVSENSNRTLKPLRIKSG